MGLESSGVPIMGDSIKVKILQDVKTSFKTQESEQSASYTKHNFLRLPYCSEIPAFNVARGRDVLNVVGDYIRTLIFKFRLFAQS
ncbi:hypothetical protein J437_LFUL017843 [Ladona fulva]|uniref:Uncharacterized protein n=1 Tax=Ladona fulva TaxID=123851 RepID=A0A8K0P8W1_LADFU|nr:hypothetical protein J437_LFUL017843 [Ladona fulva]